MTWLVEKTYHQLSSKHVQNNKKENRVKKVKNRRESSTTIKNHQKNPAKNTVKK